MIVCGLISPCCFIDSQLICLLVTFISIIFLSFVILDECFKIDLFWLLVFQALCTPLVEESPVLSLAMVYFVFFNFLLAKRHHLPRILYIAIHHHNTINHNHDDNHFRNFPHKDIISTSTLQIHIFYHFCTVPCKIFLS